MFLKKELNEFLGFCVESVVGLGFGGEDSFFFGGGKLGENESEIREKEFEKVCF